MEELAQVYGRSLFQVALEQGKLDELREQLGRWSGATPEAAESTEFDQDLAHAVETFQHGFHQMFGFRAGDQNIGRDFEEQAEKFLRARKVLHWLTCQAALQQALKLFCFLGGERALRMSEQSCRITSEHVGQNQLGVTSRILGSRRQADTGRLPYLTGGCRHFTPQWLFQP